MAEDLNKMDRSTLEKQDERVREVLRSYSELGRHISTLSVAATILMLTLHKDLPTGSLPLAFVIGLFVLALYVSLLCTYLIIEERDCDRLLTGEALVWPRRVLKTAHVLFSGAVFTLFASFLGTVGWGILSTIAVTTWGLSTVLRRHKRGR